MEQADALKFEKVPGLHCVQVPLISAKPAAGQLGGCEKTSWSWKEKTNENKAAKCAVVRMV